jgi:hypothetical protein
MEDKPGTPAEQPTQMETPQPTASIKPLKKSKGWVFAVVGVVVLMVIVTSVVLLLGDTTGMTSKIRDVFIIFLALESLIIGIALVILVVQISLLINLLQNEIKPILETTNDTVNTLKGTTTFLSSNLLEPVIKMNEYLAGLKKLIDLLFVSKR